MPPGPAKILRFSADVYDLDTVKRASYRFTDQFAFDFDIEGKEIVVRAHPKRAVEKELDGFVNDFKNEILEKTVVLTLLRGVCSRPCAKLL